MEKRLRPLEGGLLAGGAQVTSAIVIPLVVTLALGRPDCKRGTPQARLRAQLGAGGLLMTWTWVGILVAAANLHYAMASVLIGLVSLVGYLVAHRCALRPVPSLFLVFTAGAIAYPPHTWHDLPTIGIRRRLGRATAGAGCRTTGVDRRDPR